MWTIQKRIVLIETSWNVKEDKQADIKKALSVLIETSWNVKIKVTVHWINGEFVLIETSWNVKNNSSGKVKAVLPGINRNIVECKVRW